MPFLLCPFHLFLSADLFKFEAQVRFFSYVGICSPIAVLFFDGTGTHSARHSTDLSTSEAGCRTVSVSLVAGWGYGNNGAGQGLGTEGRTAVNHKNIPL